MVVVSYMTAPPDESQIKGLTFATASEDDKALTRESWNWKDVAASCAVMVLITFAYIYFKVSSLQLISLQAS